jgi:hypothetical protein
MGGTLTDIEEYRRRKESGVERRGNFFSVKINILKFLIPLLK